MEEAILDVIRAHPELTKKEKFSLFLNYVIHCDDIEKLNIIHYLDRTQLGHLCQEVVL